MRRMTKAEAMEFIEAILDCGIDAADGRTVEAFPFDKTVDEVRADLDSFLAGIPDEIDPDSIEVTDPTLHDRLLPVARIVIRTA